jgi:hypothetical protein
LRGEEKEMRGRGEREEKDGRGGTVGLPVVGFQVQRVEEARVGGFQMQRVERNEVSINIH